MKRLVLYDAPQSTCSQRVRFVLHAKGLAFEERRLDLFAGDQLRPDYLELNPNGLVPTLVHDGAPVIDSSVIMEYLEEVFPQGRTLVPADLFERARMRALMRFIDEVPTPAVRVPSYNLAFLPHFQGMSEEAFRALADAKPLRRLAQLAHVTSMVDGFVADDAKLDSFWQRGERLKRRDGQPRRHDRAVVQNPQIAPVVRRARSGDFFKRRAVPNDHTWLVAVER